MSDEQVVAGYENVKYDNRKIKLSQIQPPEYALREAQTESDVFLALKDSIKKHGILLNLVVKEIGEVAGQQTFGVIDGLQRFTCLKMLYPDGNVDVPCRVMDANEAEIAELQIIANGVRIETSPVQFTTQLRRILTSNPTMTRAALAEKLNMSEKWLNDRLNLDNLSDAAKALVDDGKIRLNHAFLLSKLQPPAEQDTFLEEAQVMPFAEFSGQVEARIKEIRKANQAGRVAGERQFVAVPQLRKIAELTPLVENEESAKINELIATENPATLADAVKLGIRYAVQLDKASVEEKRRKDAEIKAARDAKAAAARAEQARLSAEKALEKAKAVAAGQTVEV